MSPVWTGDMGYRCTETWVTGGDGVAHRITYVPTTRICAPCHAGGSEHATFVPEVSHQCEDRLQVVAAFSRGRRERSSRPFAAAEALPQTVQRANGPRGHRP